LLRHAGGYFPLCLLELCRVGVRQQQVHVASVCCVACDSSGRKKRGSAELGTWDMAIAS
jgi:hypothetical protein